MLRGCVLLLLSAVAAAAPPGKKALGLKEILEPFDKYIHMKLDRRRVRLDAFRKLVGPGAPATVAGLIRQLDLIDGALDRLDDQIERKYRVYMQFQRRYEQAALKQIKRYRKLHGRDPDEVPIPKSLTDDRDHHFNRANWFAMHKSREVGFHSWLLREVMRLFFALPESERAEPRTALLEGLRGDSSPQKLRCAGFLVRLGDAEARGAIAHAIRQEKDAGDLRGLLRIAAHADVPGLVDLLELHLKDRRWHVRDVVIEALSRQTSPRAVELLIEQLAHEKGRLLDDLAEALERLTLKKIEPEPQPWRAWWEGAKKTWRPPSAVEWAKHKRGIGQGEESVSFYGIRTRSKRVLFLIDFSLSMSRALNERSREPRVIRAKKELLHSLRMLPPDARFNIVLVSDRPRVWRPVMVKANKENKRAARRFVEIQEPGGETNAWDALQRCMDLAARTEENRDPAADTVFFLSDGKPTRGRFLIPGQIVWEFLRRNARLGVVVHCVGVSRDQHEGFLRALAQRTGGQYAGYR